MSAPSPSTRRNLTVEDVANRFSVTPNHIRELCESGSIKAINICRKANSKRKLWRMSEADIADFETTREPVAPGRKTRRGTPKPRRRDYFDMLADADQEAAVSIGPKSRNSN